MQDYRTNALPERDAPDVSLAIYRPMSRREYRLRRLLGVAPFSLAFFWCVLRLAAYYVAPEPILWLDEAFPNNFWFVIGALAVWGAAGQAVSYTRMRRAARTHRDNDAALAHMAAGDVEEAGRLLDRACAENRWFSVSHASAVANRGACFLRAGDLTSAIALLRAVADSGWLEDAEVRDAGNAAALYRHLALANALIGDVASAKRWSERAHARTVSARRDELLTLDVVLALRSGDTAGALEELDARMAGAEALLAAHQRRQLHVLDAFVRGAPLPRAEPLDLAPLIVSWPELRAYVNTASAITTR